MTEGPPPLKPLPKGDENNRDFFDFTLTRDKSSLREINPDEVRAESIRKDKNQSHNHKMELVSLYGLFLAMVLGVLIYCFGPNGETLGTALVTGPLGALSNRVGQSRPRKEEDN